jgi:hypothetical protein
LARGCNQVAFKETQRADAVRFAVCAAAAACSVTIANKNACEKKMWVSSFNSLSVSIKQEKVFCDP